MPRYYWDTRDTVEASRSLIISYFVAHGDLSQRLMGVVRWRRGDTPCGSLFWLTKESRLWLAYSVTTPGGMRSDEYYPIDLATTRPPFGGVRWWFICPACKRRVLKLHLPPGSWCSFRCQRCHGLSYQSRRERVHPFWRAWERLSEMDGEIEQAPPRKLWGLMLEQEKLLSVLNGPPPFSAMDARWERREARRLARLHPRRPGRPTRAEQRERARRLRQALRPPAPARPRGRPKVKRAYTRREPWSLATPPGDGLAFCMRCRDRRPLVDAQPVVLANGRAAVRGFCGTCGTTATRIERTLNDEHMRGATTHPDSCN